jgi:hypothetical protein
VATTIGRTRPARSDSPPRSSGQPSQAALRPKADVREDDDEHIRGRASNINSSTPPRLRLSDVKRRNYQVVIFRNKQIEEKTFATFFEI